MMSSKDAHLYGQRPASRTKTKEISSSSTLAFSSTLSSLIKSASADTNKPAAGRARPKKDDIFKTHNKGVSKRAEKDLEESDFTQKHRKRTAEEREDDEANWKRAKRRMEEKARLYNALKRGDIEDLDDKYGVDFDRKWAEAKESGKPTEEESESDSDSEASEEELIEYTDEFGRTRKGTRAEVAREERRRRTQAVAAEPDRFTARPSMPEGIIYGDTVQAEAFNPDATIAEQMAELAAKRDKELTPPPEEHFDANREKRQRGTGFFQFSKDEEERKEQLANLEKERLQTERAREARKKQMVERAKKVEERRKQIKEKRAKGQADRFLDDLGSALLKEQE